MSRYACGDLRGDGYPCILASGHYGACDAGVPRMDARLQGALLALSRVAVWVYLEALTVHRSPYLKEGSDWYPPRIMYQDRMDVIAHAVCETDLFRLEWGKP